MFEHKRLLWAMRKLRLPVSNSALVLDVGSGGNPHPRSDVLLDRLTGSEHRSGIPMLIDRFAIIADATKLPLKDKSFDFIIASHILEHMPNPAVFLQELQRVGKAGYIETPNFMCERFIPCKAHCLEIGLTQGTLQIHKKSSYLEDDFLGSLDFLTNNKGWGRVYFRDPAMFHCQYFWKDRVEYKIHNPDISCEWVEKIYETSTSTEAIVEKSTRRMDWRYLCSTFYEKIQHRRRASRLKNFDIFSILACPDCKGDLHKIKNRLHCTACETSYEYSPIINFEKPI